VKTLDAVDVGSRIVMFGQPAAIDPAVDLVAERIREQPRR
jgi:hypothetical protein